MNAQEQTEDEQDVVETQGDDVYEPEPQVLPAGLERRWRLDRSCQSVGVAAGAPLEHRSGGQAAGLIANRQMHVGERARREKLHLPRAVRHDAGKSRGQPEHRRDT